MKSLSASIVVLAGAIVFASSTWEAHDDTQVFIMLVGGALTVVGLIGWRFCLTQIQESSDTNPN